MKKSDHPSKSMSATARQVIEHELSALKVLSHYIDEQFDEIIEVLYKCTGRVVITGIGKSAIIAQKISATMNSTGTPALFMHAADAIHGDLGMIQSSDVVIIISKSGESPEIKTLVPLIRNFGNTIIAISGNAQSYLVLQADYFINTTVESEACPMNLAPTTSTTAQMVMGDALAVCLVYKRGFSAQDFAKYHPGGALGKKLYTRVIDLLNMEHIPVVAPNDGLNKVIYEISSKRLGATAVIDKNTLVGIITDGDLRRMLLKYKEVYDLTAADIMTIHPTIIHADVLAVEAYQMMSEKHITQLPVLNDLGVYVGMIHIHEIIKEGILLK